jgi:hypothetical protein
VRSSVAETEWLSNRIRLKSGVLAAPFPRTSS